MRQRHRPWSVETGIIRRPEVGLRHLVEPLARACQLRAAMATLAKRSMSIIAEAIMGAAVEQSFIKMSTRSCPELETQCLVFPPRPVERPSWPLKFCTLPSPAKSPLDALAAEGLELPSRHSQNPSASSSRALEAPSKYLRSRHQQHRTEVLSENSMLIPGLRGPPRARSCRSWPGRRPCWAGRRPRSAPCFATTRPISLLDYPC